MAKKTIGICSCCKIPRFIVNKKRRLCDSCLHKKRRTKTKHALIEMNTPDESESYNISWKNIIKNLIQQGHGKAAGLLQSELTCPKHSII